MNTARFHGAFPSGFSRALIYDRVANVGWTPGFWTGLLWLAYVRTGDSRYRVEAALLLASFRTRLELGGMGVETHDLGFLYTLSAVAMFRMTGDDTAAAVALLAADRLAARYLEGGRVIQAWGAIDDPAQRGRIIIDSTMNMPLLFWASRATGRDRYRAIAIAHLDQAARHLVREDGSTIQTYFIDPDTGHGKYARRHQAASDESCWSRGQSWGIYGFSLAYAHTGDERLRALAARLADYFLAHLPADGICFWDLSFGGNDGEEQDTSAAAIAAAGLLDLAARYPAKDTRRDGYRRAALRILSALSTDHLNHDADATGILLHAVCHHPLGEGIDESCLWGDYFFMEALMRAVSGQAPTWWADAA